MKKTIITCTAAVLLFLGCRSFTPAGTAVKGTLISDIIEGADISMRDAVITEDLVLSSAVGDGQHVIIGASLHFVNCVFEGDIDFSPAKMGQLMFAKQVVFENCVFKGEVKFNDALFFGRFQMGKCEAHHSIDLQRNTFNYRFRVDETVVGQDLILQYSRFANDFSVFGTECGRHMSSQGISVHGKSQFSSSKTGGSLIISGCHFHENFTANYLIVGDKVLAGSSQFQGRVDFLDLSCQTLIKTSQVTIMGTLRLSFKDSSPEVEKDGMFVLQKG